MGNLFEYKNKTVLVTGHTGFKGYWLCNILAFLGADVVGLSDEYIFDENKSDILGAKYKSILCDILDKNKLEKVILETKPDYIFHFAAQSLVRRSFHEAELTWRVNVNGTMNVIKAAEKLNSPCVMVCATTDKVYKNDGEFGKKFHEDDPLGGDDPYSASKAACELLISSSNYCNSLNENCLLTIKTVRAGNVVGGADWSVDRIVPDLVRSVINKRDLQIRNPLAVRPWQHVLDCCAAYLEIGIYRGAQNKFNVGPTMSENITVQKIIEYGGEHFNFDCVQVSDNSMPEKLYLELDTELQKTELGFEPKIRGREIFDLTFRWYSTLLQNGENNTLAQIRCYFNG